jgi:hypothetical protein
MGSIQVVTGSLEGTIITGQIGQVFALTDSDITVTSPSLGTQRFTLLCNGIFTDTGQPSTQYTITSVTVWGQGEVLIYKQ